MKKDKKLLLIFIVSCFLQEMYCIYSDGLLSPFSFLQGITKIDNSGLPYLEFCAICLPIIILVLLFSDTYNFQIENYGRLLLIRNCNLRKRILTIYLITMYEILGCIFIQFIISLIFNFKYFCHNQEIIIMELMAYTINIFLLIVLEIFVSSFIEENLCQIVMNIYVYLSFVISFFVNNIIIRIICFPGTFMCIGQRVYTEKFLVYIIYELVIPFILIFLVFALTIYRCKKKDYLS